MLTISSACRRLAAPSPRRFRGASLALGKGLGLGTGLALGALLASFPSSGWAEPANTPMPGLTPEGRPQRPAGFVLLEERSSFDGMRAVGVFGARPDPGQEGLWRVQLWEEVRDRVTIATDKVSCRPGAPLRITGRSRTLIVRELNPGGAITPANRLDHQIWWAVCHPTLAGRDPATLGPEARRLGFDGRLIEREQILPLP